MREWFYGFLIVLGGVAGLYGICHTCYFLGQLLNISP